MSRHLDDTGTGHPILGFLDLLESGLDDIAGAPAWSLKAEETASAITRLVSDLGRLAEVEARLLDQAQWWICQARSVRGRWRSGSRAPPA